MYSNYSSIGRFSQYCEQISRINVNCTCPELIINLSFPYELHFLDFNQCNYPVEIDMLSCAVILNSRSISWNCKIKIILFWALPSSQSCPVKPFSQLQEYPPFWLVHVPPCLQGLDSHSSISRGMVNNSHLEI